MKYNETKIDFASDLPQKNVKRNFYIFTLIIVNCVLLINRFGMKIDFCNLVVCLLSFSSRDELREYSSNSIKAIDCSSHSTKKHNQCTSTLANRNRGKMNIR